MEAAPANHQTAWSLLEVVGWPSRIRLLPASAYVVNSKAYYDRIALNFARVIYPVLLTMIATLYLRASYGNFNCFYRRTLDATYDPSSLNDDDVQQSWIHDNLYWVIIICVWFVALIVATSCLVVLVKYHLERFMFFFLYLSVFVFLGALGGRYLFYWFRSVCWNFDWITLVYISFNFCAGGLICIFWKAPRLLNQAYLIILSAIMGHVFQSSLPDWAVWILLALLVLWDLFAVLAPFGPLKALIKVASRRQNELPGLLYDTNPISRGREDQETVQAQREFRERDRANAPYRRWFNGNQAEAHASNDASATTALSRNELANTAASGIPMTETQAPLGLNDTKRAEQSTILTNGSPVPLALAQTRSSFVPHGTMSNEQVERKASEFLTKNVKLGLGDFVFYSVLTSVSTRFGFMAVATSFSGVIAGLCLTFILLITTKRPLPALPLSLTFGIIAYFVTRYGLSPFVGSLLEVLMFN